MVQIKHTKANLEDLIMSEQFQKPNIAFEQFWNGPQEDLFLYYKKHNIEYNFKADNLEQLNEKSNNYLNSLMEAVKKDIGKFDFRLRSALNPKSLEISSDDYMKLEFDIGNVDNSQIISNFLNAKSRSFVDFRKFEDNKLTLIYNRRAIYDEGSRIAIVKAKQSVTLRDNFKEAKDNNFVLSGFLKELVKNGAKYDFMHEYMAGDSKRQMIITNQEINKDTEIVEDIKKTALKDVEIVAQAQKEVKQEDSQNRQSLRPDSNINLINKEASTEIRVDTRPLQKVTKAEDTEKVINAITEDSISDYAQKEMEKLKIRLAKAEEDAKIVYQEIKLKITDDGMSVQEALNFAKQKYREEHTINLASVLLSKDLLQVSTLEKIIIDKEKEILNLEHTISDKDNAITKREETISSLKSTLQTKENDLRLSNERHQTDIDYLTKDYEKAIDDMTNGFETKVKSLEEELSKSEEIIIRLSEQKNIYEKDLQENSITLNQKNNEIIDLKSTLQTKNNEIKMMEERISQLENSLKSKENYIENKFEEMNELNKKTLDFLSKTDIILAQNKDEVSKSDIGTKQSTLEEILKSSPRKQK